MTPRSPHPEELADAFFAVAHGLKRTVNARFQHTGLSLARLRVLFQLVDSEGIRMGELSQCVDVAPRTMTSTVDAMERDGLVRRQPDPVDRRATVVTITDAGRRSFEEGRRLQARAVADLFHALDADQRAQLLDILDRLAAATATATAGTAAMTVTRATDATDTGTAATATATAGTPAMTGTSATGATATGATATGTAATAARTATSTAEPAGSRS